MLEDTNFQFLGTRGCLNGNQKQTSDEVTLTDMSGVVDKGINFGKAFTLREILEDVNSKRFVFFGEQGEDHDLAQVETVLAMAMLARHQQAPGEENPAPVLNIVLEPFTFDLQEYLDAYQAGKIGF